MTSLPGVELGTSYAARHRNDKRSDAQTPLHRRNFQGLCPETVTRQPKVAVAYREKSLLLHMHMINMPGGTTALKPQSGMA